MLKRQAGDRSCHVYVEVATAVMLLPPQKSGSPQSALRGRAPAHEWQESSARLFASRRIIPCDLIVISLSA